MDFGAARGGIEKQVAQLARIWLDINGTLVGSRVALENQDLVLRATFLLDRVHGAGGVGAR